MLVSTEHRLRSCDTPHSLCRGPKLVWMTGRLVVRCWGVEHNVTFVELEE